MTFGPNPNVLYPLEQHPEVVFLKNCITRPNIRVGSYTYYHDHYNPLLFETRNVLYHFEFLGDQLVIGNFCAIASGAKFIMNGANHETAPISTFPFGIFGNGWETIMENVGPITGSKFPFKGDTVIGNDVWIGYEAMIMPGVKIGNGAIIGTRAMVTKDVPDYAVVCGNPGRVVRMRFDDATIRRLLDIAWWYWPPEKITRNLALINAADVDALEKVV